MIFTIAVELPTFKHMEPSQPSLLGILGKLAANVTH
jgi:hypothetical protein